MLGELASTHTQQKVTVEQAHALYHSSIRSSEEAHRIGTSLYARE